MSIKHDLDEVNAQIEQCDDEGMGELLILRADLHFQAGDFAECFRDLRKAGMFVGISEIDAPLEVLANSGCWRPRPTGLVGTIS